MPNQNTVPNQTFNSAFPQGGFVDQMRNTGTYTSPFAPFLPNNAQTFTELNQTQIPQSIPQTMPQTQPNVPTFASPSVGANVNTAQQPLTPEQQVEMLPDTTIVDRLRRLNPDFFAPVDLSAEQPFTTDQELYALGTTGANYSDIYNTFTEQIQQAQQQYMDLLGQSSQEMQIQNELADLQNKAKQFQQSYQAGFDAITDRVIPLEAQVGEQASLQRQASRTIQDFATQEANLLNRLGLAQQARESQRQVAEQGVTNLMTNFGLQLEAQQMIDQQNENVFNRVMTLRQDSQNVLANIINSFSGLSINELDPQTQMQIQNLASRAGVPFDLLAQGMEVVKNQLEFNQMVELGKLEDNQGISPEEVVRLGIQLFGTGEYRSLNEAYNAAAQVLGAGGTNVPTPNGYQTAPAGGFRTDRHNNPTAFTTDLAKQAGLVEGVDYVVGDPFPDNPNLFTAKLIGDPIDQTIRLIDNVGFYTQAGQQRWTHTALDQGTWANMGYDQKREVIKDMYKAEGGSGSIFGEEPEAGFQLVPGYEKLSPLAQKYYQGLYTPQTPSEIDALSKEIADAGLELPGTMDAMAIVKGIFDSLELLKQVPNRYRGTIQGRAAEGRLGFIPTIPAADFNQEAAAFKSATDFIGMKIARLIEKGRMSDQDRAFYLNLMPKLRMSNNDIAEEASRQLLNRIKDTFNLRNFKIKDPQTGQVYQSENPTIDELFELINEGYEITV